MCIGISLIILLIVGLCLGLWPCGDGFSGHGLGGCQDVDECNEIVANCHRDAVTLSQINNVGSYECTCKDGHQGNGIDCYDLNECTLGKSLETATDNCLWFESKLTASSDNLKLVVRDA